MLHVEEPDPERPCDIDDWQLYKQQDMPAKCKSDKTVCCNKYRIDEIRVQTLFLFRPFPVEAVGIQEQKEGSQPEHDKWIAVETVLQPFPFIRLLIFLHRHHPYVADAALIEITACCMMD